MRTVTAILVGLVLVSTASAESWSPWTGHWEMIDDMESYTVDASIHGQGGWQVQRNSSAIGDTGYCLAVDDGTGNTVVDLVNRGFDGGIDTIFAAYELPTPLTGQSELRLTFRTNGWTDTIMGTNDLGPGWTDVDEDGNIDPGGQGTGNYDDQGAMVVLKTADMFRARDGDAYQNVPGIGTLADTWYDLYMLIDSPNDRTLYAMAPAGGELQLIPSPEGDWWDHRNTSYDQVSNLKFLFGGGVWPPVNPDGWTEELHVQIDNIMIWVPEPATMSLLALGSLADLRRRRAQV